MCYCGRYLQRFIHNKKLSPVSSKLRTYQDQLEYYQHEGNVHTQGFRGANYFSSSILIDTWKRSVLFGTQIVIPNGEPYEVEERVNDQIRVEDVATCVFKRLNYTLVEDDPIRTLTAKTGPNVDRKSEIVVSASQPAQGVLM